jgi:hypothetical protein
MFLRQERGWPQAGSEALLSREAKNERERHPGRAPKHVRENKKSFALSEGRRYN